MYLLVYYIYYIKSERGSMNRVVFDKESLARQIDKGFEYLTEKERMILTLLYYEDYSPDEVCEILDLTFGEYINVSTNAKTKMRHYTNVFDVLPKGNLICGVKIH